MQVMKWSVIALAVAAGTTQMAVASQQSESKGFVEDSSLNILTRSLYMNRDFHDGSGNKPTVDSDGDGELDTGFLSGYREEWGLGFIGTFESGFTQGAVGFGVDAIGLLGVKLDTGDGRNGNGLFPVGADGEASDDYSEAGAAVKARVSNTVIKYGDQFVAVPVFSTDDSRLLPETAEGFMVSSGEIEGLELNLGHFTTLNAQDQTYHDSANGGALESITFVGGAYSFTDQLSGALYYSTVDATGTVTDAGLLVDRDYEKTYANLNYSLPLNNDQALAFDFNIYKTDADAADSDNVIWSLGSTYSVGAHSLTLAHQRSSGDAGYAYGIDGGGTVWLANSVQYSDFNGEDEKSWQVRYDLNMAAYGIPGLSFMTRYIEGYDIDAGTESNAKENEWDIEAKYVLQDGPAKDLSFRLRNAFYHADSEYGTDLTDTRLIIEYPLSIL